MPVDKFNRGIIVIPPLPQIIPPPPQIKFLRYDGKNYWCNNKKVHIAKTNLVRVNNKYKTGLEVNGKPFKNEKLVFLYKKKLLTYVGSTFNCAKSGHLLCTFAPRRKQSENWEPFKE